MRAPQPIQSDERHEVASLLVPLVDKVLLMPNVTVAEIVPVGIIEEGEGPDWLLGHMQWRDLSVPLMSLEVLNGHSRPDIDSRSRVAVLNTTGVSEELGFVAVVTQGLPRLARVTPEEIREAESAEPEPFDAMVVNWAGESAVIPDVAKLERTYLSVAS